MYVHIYTHIYYIHINLYIHIYIYILIDSEQMLTGYLHQISVIYTYVYMYVFVWMCIHTYMHIYKHIYTAPMTFFDTTSSGAILNRFLQDMANIDNFVPNAVLDLCSKTLEVSATHCNTLQHTTAQCNTLQHSATHCNAKCKTLEVWHWQLCSKHCHRSLFDYLGGVLPNTAQTHCNTLQYTATHCSTLPHTTTPCNTQQHAVTQSARFCSECCPRSLFQNFGGVLQHSAFNMREKPHIHRNVRHVVFICALFVTDLFVWHDSLSHVYMWHGGVLQHSAFDLRQTQVK